MQEFHTDNQLDEIRKIAHTWKGFCAPYGFATLGVVAGELEQKLKAQDQDVDVAQYIEFIDDYLGAASDHQKIKPLDV